MLIKDFSCLNRFNRRKNEIVLKFKTLKVRSTYEIERGKRNARSKM